MTSFLLKKGAFVLIESDWNLKAFHHEKLLNYPGVLIESDWNLKSEPERVYCVPCSVLIESDWNLKNVAPKVFFTSPTY